ncbi:MAG: aminotransferase class III-fold pyridoxal phosphate-dependent enzyme [Spirochaetota bacterium]
MDTALKIPIKNIKLSLKDILGDEYIRAVCEAGSFLEGKSEKSLLRIAEEQVEFYPEWYAEQLDRLVDSIGKKVVSGFSHSARGAATEAYVSATNTKMAPLSGFGFLRIGEDGRAYLTSKSEHYHASLGHNFPGYELIEKGKKLGIAHMTHNNTRGHITRRLEEELIRTANGLDKDDRTGLRRVLEATEPHIVNRVINLHTGSLVVEAALKMLLARFYKYSKNDPVPKYEGRIPVFLVIGDNEGGLTANYHGTTILTQAMRGLWPDFVSLMEKSGIMLIKPVRINDPEIFKKTVDEWDNGNYKVGGFFHELILMNYGGIKLDKGFIKSAYEICREHDIPTLVDEIQSCIWYPELFIFHEYGIKPDMISVGKGFSGGQYPTARILTTAAIDNLNQFGALVTNGQEELASLTFLITMEYAEANKEYIKSLGAYYENSLKALAARHRKIIAKIEGQGHLSSIFFHTEDTTVQFVKKLNEEGIDISAHTYKTNSPPSALTKLPLTSSYKVVDFLLNRMDEAIKTIE